MPTSKQILVFAALPIEAKPVVRHFNLKKDVTRTTFDTFTSNNITLITSGLGKTKMAAAVGYSIAMSQQTPFAAINFGIAGAPRHDGFQLGQVFLANKIVDSGSGRQFFPDLFVDTGIPETTVTTHDRPVISRSQTTNYCGLQDMEASGFFVAASSFFPPHKIAIVKTVSDHLEDGHLTENLITEYIEKSIPGLENVISTMSSIPSRTTSVLKQSAKEFLQNLGTHLRLTSSQCKLLEDWAIGYIHRGGDNLPVLEQFMSQTITEKRESKLVFEQIRKLLNES